mmetsp:Transcript_62224/g.144776  ORF Transcript_62224/g.144776 Transcript_62224/m.144776 type:complete len:93 (+) Transcript_62224:146-424(+)
MLPRGCNECPLKRDFIDWRSPPREAKLHFLDLHQLLVAHFFMRQERSWMGRRFGLVRLVPALAGSRHDVSIVFSSAINVCAEHFVSLTHHTC